MSSDTCMQVMDAQHDDNAIGILNGAGHLVAQLSLIIIAVVATVIYIIRNENWDESEETSNQSVRISIPNRKTPMPNNVLSSVDENQPTVNMATTTRGGTARSEYRAIVDHDDYEDLCSGDVDCVPELTQYTKPPKVKYATTTPWSASLESITEEEEGTSGDGRCPVDSDSSSGTYATYINNVNESPKIYHAGRVWCITKSRSVEPEQDVGYLETDIDNVSVNVLAEKNPTTYHEQGYHDDNLGENPVNENEDIDTSDPVLAVMPTPTYLLQGTAIPAAYPGHSQFLTDQSHESNHDNVDRPNFITTEDGNAEWSYSFPIATDAFASILDQHVEPSESAVTYSNVHSLSSPSVGRSSETNLHLEQPIPKVGTSSTKAPVIDIQTVSNDENTIDASKFDQTQSDNNKIADYRDKPHIDDKLSGNTWVETFTSTIILPVPDLSPTIHREEIPIENEFYETQIVQTFAENQEAFRKHPDGLLETDIDMIQFYDEVPNEPVNELNNDHKVKGLPNLEDWDMDICQQDQFEDDDQVKDHTDLKEGDKVDQTYLEEGDTVKVQKDFDDGDKGKGQKSKRFMDKFRKSESTETKESKEKDAKSKTNKVKNENLFTRKFRLSGKKKSKKKRGQEEVLEIDDDEDLTTLHLSDEDDGEEEEVQGSLEYAIEESPNEITPPTETVLQSPQTTDSEKEPQSRPTSSNASQYSRQRSKAGRPSVRLLCCQAPKLRSTGSDPYLIPIEQQTINGRQSNVTEITELIANSSEDDIDHVITPTYERPEYINGIELEPGQLIMDDLIPEEQTEMVVSETNDPNEKPNIEVRSYIRLSSYTPPKLSESPITFEKVEKEFKVPIASCDDTSDINGSTLGSINGSLHENGSIIEPKGYAGENVHAFYLIGTPGNVMSVDDAIKQIESMPNKATSSTDMCTENKQRHSNLDKESVELLSYTNNNHIPLLTHNQSALNSNHLELDSEPDCVTQKQRSTNYPGKIQSVIVNNDSLGTGGNTEHDKSDRIQDLLTEFRTDVTKYAGDKQGKAPISKQEEEKPSQPSDLTTVKFDPIVAKKQPDTQQSPQVQTPESEAYENNSVASFASDASARASLIIAEQRARVRESLSRLNLPDWYKKSRHHNKTVKDELVVDYPDYASEPRFMSCSPTAGGSDWSMDSTGTGSSFGAATKLSFLSEARYKRAYHNYDRYYKHFPSTDRPIRTAFSCVELPGDGSYASKTPERRTEPETADKYHSSDALLSVNDEEPTIKRQAASVLQSSPYHKSTPNLSPGRNRSLSTGESGDDNCNLNALSIRRLERETNDAVFFITGRVEDNALDKNVSELVSPGDDSGFNDSYEPSGVSRYEVKQAHIRPTDSMMKSKPTPPNEVIQKHSAPRVYSQPFALISSPPSKPPRHSPEPPSSDAIDSTKPNSYQFIPITRAQDEVTQSIPSKMPNQSKTPKYGDMSTSFSADNIYSANTIRPDPRYKSDGSRNEKIAPFPMVTQSNEELSSSREGSPGRNKKCNVRITITDTSLDSIDDETIPIEPTSGSLQYTPTTRPKSPIDFNELKESNFAAVLSVVTSSSTQGTPAPAIKPPPEVSMEEIVDSLLGLSSNSRSPSRADLQVPDNHPTTSFETTVPELNMSSSSEQQQQRLSSTHNRSSSLDSLFSDEGLSPLNSIIIKNDGEEDSSLSSSSKQSTPRSARDIVGDEIVMV